MTKQIAKEEMRSNYLSFLHPFLEEQGDKLEDILNSRTENHEQVENGKKRKVDEGLESDDSEKISEEDKAFTPSKKRKLGELMTGGKPLWEEVKSRSFAKGTFLDLWIFGLGYSL